MGGEERQRDLNPAARRLEGTGSKAQTKWSAAFGGFLFLRCLGLGFVLELVLGDEGCRSEAPGPSWRLSRGGIRQERRPRGLPVLAHSPRLQTRSGGWSRELGSNRKTSLAWFSLLQQSSREQGVFHLRGSSCSFSSSLHCSRNLPSGAFSPPAPVFSCTKGKIQKAVAGAGGCEQNCLPELGGGCFPSPESREGELWGSPWIPSIFSCLVFCEHNCLLCSSSLIFFFKAHFCTQTRLVFCLFIGLFSPLSLVSLVSLPVTVD